MNISGFTNWMQSVLPPEKIELLPAFLDWLSYIQKEPGGDTALSSLEEFALKYAQESDHETNPLAWGSRWFMLSTLAECRDARRFYQEGDRNTVARQSASEYGKDLDDLRDHLKGALDIIRRHDRMKTPLLTGHVFDLMVRDLPKRNIEFYEEQEIFHRGPGVIDEKGFVHMAEGSPGRSRSLTPATVARFFEAFLETLDSSPRFSFECGAYREDYGCLSYPVARTDQHKKKTEKSTMLAALLTTLFSHYRRGLPSPLSRWTPVEKGIAEDYKLAAKLINVSLPLKKDEAFDSEKVKGRIRKLLLDNPGVKVMSWY